MFVTLITLGIVFFLGVIYTQEISESTNQNRSETIEFVIKKGEGANTISSHLAEKTLLRSRSAFILRAIIEGKNQNFHPGIYILKKGMSIGELLIILTDRAQGLVKVVIPEGSTLRDVEGVLIEEHVLEQTENLEKALSSASQRSGYAFLNSKSNLEGFLFPDTYNFEVGLSGEQVAKIFLENFRTKAWPVLLSREDWYERLVLASMLEREVKEFKDKQLVAGIILKRKEVGMLLQVDATLSYAKCNAKIRGCESLQVRKADTNIESPYNTYARKGFPPTPIGNPGLDSIKAALSPRSSPYFYYLSAAKTGETIFAETLEEHNLYRERYL